MTELELRKQLCRIGSLLYQRELIIGNAGNLSVRVEPNRYLTTPTGSCKGFLEPRDLVVVDLDGKRLGGSREPSTEFGMHRTIYAVRADVKAVVHAHPAIATAFTVAGRSLEAPILTEGLLTIGIIATAAYATPGTPAVGAGLADIIRDHDAVLLAHHGAVTVGPDLETAYYNMETVEHTAKTYLAAHMLGGAQTLCGPEVALLLSRRATAPLTPSSTATYR